MPTKLFTKYKTYTFNSLGLEDDRCIKYDMFTMEYETFNTYNLSFTVTSTNNSSLQISCNIEDDLELNTDVTVGVKIHYLSGLSIYDYIASFTIPKGNSGYTKSITLESTVIPNYVGISIDSLTYDTSLTLIEVRGIDDNSINKMLVPATLSISGYEKLDDSLIKFEIDFDNAIYQYYQENEVLLTTNSTLNGSLDEPINIGMEITNGVTGNIKSIDLDVAEAYPGINEIESNIGSNFLSGANSSDIEITIIDIQPLNTSRFTLINPNVQQIYVSDQTSEGGVNFYLSKTESTEGIPNDSLLINNGETIAIPYGYPYLICEVFNSSDDETFGFGLVINDNTEVDNADLQPQETIFFCVSINEYNNNGVITAEVVQY